jgi:oligogalacturonide lyase
MALGSYQAGIVRRTSQSRAPFQGVWRLAARPLPHMKKLSGPLLAVLCIASTARAADPLPREWIDPDTGHRIVQLSTVPGTNSLYFTQYGFTANGTKLLMTVHGGIDLVTIDTGVIEHVLDGPTGRVLQTGRKTGAIFYTKDGAVYALDPVTKVSRMLAKLPPGGSVVTVNCDETLAAGSITQGEAPVVGSPLRAERNAPANPVNDGEPAVQKGGDNYPDKHAMMDRRLAARTPMTLFTVNLQTGEIKELLHTTDWINHFQFSPWIPRCCSMPTRAGSGRWTGSGCSAPTASPSRSSSTSARCGWRSPSTNTGATTASGSITTCRRRSRRTAGSGYNVTDGSRIWYHVPPNHWSVHYNTSPDGTLFSGDGSDPVLHYAKAQDAKWMFLFHPELIPNEDGETADQAGMIQAARLIPERLVNLGKHDYSLEPNGNFSPDGKWLIFRSNMRGPIQVYAVEVAKAK